jgi:hypothetical protein
MSAPVGDIFSVFVFALLASTLVYTCFRSLDGRE